MKRRIFSWFLTLCLLLAALPLPAAFAQETAPQTVRTALSQRAQRMLGLVNNERKKAGAPALTANNSALQRAADIRAKEISALFSHSRPDGQSCFTVFNEVNLSPLAAGENIAYNFGYADTVAITMEGWMNSPGHRANILNPDFQQIGIGLYENSGRYYWVQLFYTGENPDEPKPYPPTPFVDIETHWGRDAICWAWEEGLFSGTAEDLFSPNKKLERGMLSQVLYRLAGEPPLSGKAPFSDVPSGAYYAGAVAWAFDNGIVDGVGDNRFNPKGLITREQLAVMLHRYAGCPEAENEASLAAFSDSASVSRWARRAISWAVEEGILNGKSGNRLDPRGNATRAEAAAMLQRFAG